MADAPSYESLVLQVKQLQKDLEQSRQTEEKYYRVLDSTSEGFMLLDNHLAITEVNLAVLKMSGYGREDFIGVKIEKFYDQASVSFYSASRDHLSFEARFRSKTGQEIPMLFSRSIIRDDTGSTSGYMYFLADLTELKIIQQELKKAEQRYRNLANHDNLTGLYNTRYLYKALDELVRESKRKSRLFSLVFMDMDNFKRVVDTYGHLNGSQALKEVAETIKNCLQKPCFGVAYGGDEFVVVLPGFDKRQAAQKADEIRAEMKQTVYLTRDGHNVRLGASFGIATFPEDSDSHNGLLGLADKAMFRIKQTGKDSIGITKA